MTELIAPRRPSVADLERGLAGQFTVSSSPVAVVEWVLLDTFDALLRAEALELRWEDGRLVLVGRTDGAQAAPPADFPEPVAPVPATALPHDELGRIVRGIVDVRALLPRARLRVTTQTVALLDSLEKTVVRLRVDSPVLIPPQGRQRELGTRVLALPVRGYHRELATVWELLGRELGLSRPDSSLADEAVVLAGGARAGVGSKVDVGTQPGERADVAVARVLIRLWEVVEANLPGTIADIDSEFLHDLRVSVRRSRAVQRELKGTFEPESLAHMRAELRWLQQVTGEARDLDVWVLGFESIRELLPKTMRPDLRPLQTVLERRRVVAHGAMVRALRGSRMHTLREDWPALLNGLVASDETNRPDAAKPIEIVAGRRIRRVYRKMLSTGRAILDTGDEAPPEDYHELRKQGKELRYLLELLGAPLHDPAVVGSMVKTLKRLQDVLGHHQDREVEMQALRQLSDEVAPLPGGPRGLLAMGLLIERLEEDAAAARSEFAERFEAFAGKAQRRLVKDTFA
jgi:CHAD domain-containing protein